MLNTEIKEDKTPKKKKKSRSFEPESSAYVESPAGDTSAIAIENGQTDEERKQMAIMKKYYRNRYSSFLQALATKKADEEKAAEIAREKEEKRKTKIREKVLGTNQIASKFLQDKQSSDESQHEYDDLNGLIQ